MNSPMNKKHVLVIGDIMLDKYHYGSSSRRSPEADVPVLDLNETRSGAGGAANVALCLAHLDLNVSLIGIIGKDHNGTELKNLLQNNSNFIDINLIEDPDRPTTTKTRIISDQKHLLRIDKENKNEITETQQSIILDHLIEGHKSDTYQAVILQDYDKGIFSESLIEKILNFCQKRGVKTLIDPKHKNFFSYQSPTLFKPNLNELGVALNKNLNTHSVEDITKELSKLKAKIQASFYLITMSSNGILLHHEGKTLYQKAHQIQNPDVCGAGDAVLAAASKALIDNLSIEQMLKLCNRAGYLSCLEVGVHPEALKKMTKKTPSLYEDIKIKYV